MTGKLATARPVDVLVIAAHRDDAELLCGGTLARCADQGHTTGILDLTAGEMGTRGTAEVRAAEADAAADVLGVSVRLNAGLPDAGVFNTQETRELLVGLIRALTPRVVILPYLRGRHPDHRLTAELGRDACFLAGLARFGGDDAPHRPQKILYAMAYREDAVKPTFVVDITDQFERKRSAIACYASQFEGDNAAGEAFPSGQPLLDLLEAKARHYGTLIRKGFGEPFYTDETMEANDVTELGVRSL
ncbi:MAG: bacillithiol biosynthesis deacetylase BshB1 [Gemmatimonadota bacterium]